MIYGLTFEEVAKVNRPQEIKFKWGSNLVCVEREEYGLQRTILKKGGVQPLHFYLRTRGVYFVEKGEVFLRVKRKDGRSSIKRLIEGRIFHAPPGLPHGLCGVKESVVYFSSLGIENNNHFDIETEDEAVKNFNIIDQVSLKINLLAETTFDYHKKYWGSIETITSDDFSCKRIFLKQGSQSSLEFHCMKTETYFVQSGKLKLGLRLGRGENRSIIIDAGESFYIVPGLMHMRIGIEDCVIIEVSTRDSDTDSHLVEDGKTYVHLEKSYKEEA